MFKRVLSLSLVLTTVATLSVGCRRNLFDVTTDQAKGIALADAGLTEEQVTWLRTEPDRDDGKVVYDVSFRHGNTEYEYDIDATSGEIVGKDIDSDILPTTMLTTTTVATTLPATTAVTAAQAQTIALTDAGFSANQVSNLRTELDRDDGQEHFDVHFFKDGIEYEYEIDGATGNILSFDKDDSVF